MKRYALPLLVTALVSLPVHAQEPPAGQDIELHCTIAAEAGENGHRGRGQQYGVLDIVLAESNGGSLAGQVFAGAIDQRGFLYNIPVREVREGKTLRYRGTFHYSPPETLRFLVNASHLGRVMQCEFTREFSRH